MAAAASSSAAPSAAADMPAPTSSSSASEPLPSAEPARPRRRCRIREVSSRYLSTPLLAPSPSARLSTSSLSHSATAPSPRLSTSSLSHSSTPSTPRAHHRCMPAAPAPAATGTGLADENRPPQPQPPPTPGSRKRGAARDLFEEMHRPRLNPLAAAGAAGATGTPGPGPRRILCPSSRASPNVTTAAQRRRGGCARPSTPARTSFNFYSASSEVSAAAAFDSRTASPSPGHIPFPELRTSPPGTTTDGSGRPPKPFCFRALALALPDDRQTKRPAAMVKPPPAGKAVVVKKGAAVMGGSKAAGRQEDVHKLRILNNCYTQYRFLNAQAETVAMTKKAVAEESLYGLSERIANLQRSVAQKKAELESLKRMEKVDFVVNAQMPSLQQWCELEKEHISCLASGTVALYDAASHIPILGNIIKNNTGGVKSALNSAMEITKKLSPCAEKLSRKVEEIEDVASELKNVVSNEQVLLQECADLLRQAHDVKAMEDSLRIQVMQLKSQTKNKT